MNLFNVIAYIEMYIHIQKGVNIRIDTNNIDMEKLIEAYKYARQWMEEHNTVIQQHFTYGFQG